MSELQLQRVSFYLEYVAFRADFTVSATDELLVERKTCMDERSSDGRQAMWLDSQMLIREFK
jgi:hypothetical protein